MSDIKGNKCNTCQYCGDKFSFPLPNDMIVDHHYCCCGDNDNYEKDILNIEKCDCYEEL